MHWFDGGWHMGWMAIGWLVVPLLLVLFVWPLLRGARDPNGPSESPERVLKSRYARGEIDRETYLRMLSDLKAG